MHTELKQKHSLGPPMKFDTFSLKNLENLSKKIKCELWIPFVVRWGMLLLIWNLLLSSLKVFLHADLAPHYANRILLHKMNIQHLQACSS